jgi:hypothetical protein
MDVKGRLPSVPRVRRDLADDRLGQTEKNSVWANSREISAWRRVELFAPPAAVIIDRFVAPKHSSDASRARTAGGVEWR